jgi:hypothetical protein
MTENGGLERPFLLRRGWGLNEVLGRKVGFVPQPTLRLPRVDIIRRDRLVVGGRGGDGIGKRARACSNLLGWCTAEALNLAEGAERVCGSVPSVYQWFKPSPTSRCGSPSAVVAAR